MAYVPGPVIRDGTPMNPWVQQCYSIIEEAAKETRQRASLPYVEARLDNATPQEFSGQILGRIQDAQSVVAVFLPNDPSTPIECALAVGTGKRVLILHAAGTRVPRILAGLPSVEMLEFEGFGQDNALETISTFLRSS